MVGVGGTTFVAIRGFHSTRDATQKTLEARRDDRLRARKADAYQDAMTAALQRHDSRQQVLDAKAPPEALELQVSQEWFDMQGRLKTFGALKVVTAFEDSMKASERLNVPHEDTIAVTEDFKDDLHNAMAADDTLVWAIRFDLGIEAVATKPNAIDLSQPKAPDRDRLTPDDRPGTGRPGAILHVDEDHGRADVTDELLVQATERLAG